MDINVSAFRMQEQRLAADRANLDDVIAKQYITYGSFQVNDSGATTVSIDFPVKYVSEPPILHAGGYLKPGQDVNIATFPELDVAVIRYEEDSRPPIQRYFIGATIAVKTYGLRGQVFIVQYTFTGMALSSPSGTGLGGLDEPI